jgi:predicted ATPase
MLQKITLENFKSHQLTELNLDNSRLHALVGQNSSGKTSVLQALHYLSLLAESPFKDIFKHDRAPQFITTIGAEAMSVTARGFWVDKHQHHWQASYSFKQRSADDWFPTASLKVDNLDKNQKIKDGTVAGWPSSFQHSADPIPLNLRHSVYLKLVANHLAKPALSEDIKPRVEYDGSGLAPTLDYLRDEAPDKFEELQKMLQRIVPGVRKVGLKLAKVTVHRQRTIKVDDQSSVPYQETQELMGKEVVLDMNTGKRIPGHAMSEGTMLTLGLLTVLINPNQPNLVLLDDLEQGLHPYAQRELMNALKEIIAAHPNLQIIFSTHSSYIVDELQPSQVHILNNSQTGFTVAKRLDEHPDTEWAIESLMTGEFWDSVGEEWVVAGAVNG